MLAKIRMLPSATVAMFNDVLITLFEAKPTSIAQLSAALQANTAGYLDTPNSYIDLSKKPYGWTVDYISGSGATRTAVLKAPCRNSTKQKYISLNNASNTLMLQTGTGRASPTNISLTDTTLASSIHDSSVIAVANATEMYVSSSDRLIQ